MKFNTLTRIGLLLLLGLSAEAKELRSSRCELFIDKLITNSFRDYRMTRIAVELYVKVRPELLDGAIRRVVFHSQKFVRNRGETQYTPFEDTELSRFAGSRDYFRLDLGMLHYDANAGGAEITHEGAFFVETVRGTRYWLNTYNGGNFVFDTQFAERVCFQNDPGPVSWSPRRADLSRVPRTSDNQSGSDGFVNQQLCR